MGIVHADAAATAESIRQVLHKRFHPTEIVVGSITAVIGVHTGPDAWGVFYQLEDGMPPRAGTK
jgi:fatty acid-binding protein DegV